MKSTDEYDVQSRFQHKIDYETILLQQMGRIAQYRSSKELKYYQSSIDTLIYMLPLGLRNLALEFKHDNQVVFSMSSEGLNKYDQLWEYINGLLEENNLIYHTKYVKSYK